MTDWADEHAVLLAFIQPEEPAQNAFIERFKRSYREAVLDSYLFETISEAQAISEDWLEDYHAIRSHEALGGVPRYRYGQKQPRLFHFQLVLKLGPLLRQARHLTLTRSPGAAGGSQQD